MPQFTKTQQNKVRRLPKRGSYDKQTIYNIIDEGLICHVGFVVGDQPFVIPTLHGRIDDQLFLHGSNSSRLMRWIAEGNPISAAITILDGLVLAKSVFHHSVNYRSVVLFGKGQLLEEDADKLIGLEAITNHVSPGRWQEARLPTQHELDITAVAAIPIDSASAKIRSGPPLDDIADMSLPVWSGVLPLRLEPLPAEPTPDVQESYPIPEVIRAYRRSF